MMKTVEKIKQQVIDDTFAVNVRGSILMTRKFVKHRGDYRRIIIRFWNISIGYLLANIRGI